MADNDMWTIKAALDWTVGFLERKGDENPRLSAEWLMSEATGLSRIELYVNFERPLTLDERAVLRDFVARRGRGEPLQLISGKVPFRYITVLAAPNVLIPRPETEVLVSEAFAELKLPAGKKAFVMSLDDLSYYHSYDGRGIASKIVLDENGKPTCEYVQADGTMVTGAYDCVPLLDQFIEEHPDASYHGAKGMIALTGYDGILGYRTDIAYKTHENLTDDQQAWLDAHPDFNWDDERAEATKVADAIKADGWEFSSHTWGHIRIGDASMERIQTDTQKWLEYVAPLVGGTDTIIFAHGQDLADWHDYTTDNEKFNYLSSQGFHFYCNVDSSQYFLQIRDNYVRQGRRNLDGYRLWNDVHGDVNRTSDLFDASQILDPRRTDVPAL